MFGLGGEILELVGVLGVFFGNDMVLDGFGCYEEFVLFFEVRFFVGRDF